MPFDIGWPVAPRPATAISIKIKGDLVVSGNMDSGQVGKSLRLMALIHGVSHDAGALTSAVSMIRADQQTGVECEFIIGLDAATGWSALFD